MVHDLHEKFTFVPSQSGTNRVPLLQIFGSHFRIRSNEGPIIQIHVWTCTWVKRFYVSKSDNVNVNIEDDFSVVNILTRFAHKQLIRHKHARTCMLCVSLQHKGVSLLKPYGNSMWLYIYIYILNTLDQFNIFSHIL